MKKLTDEGIEEVDEVVDIDTPPKEPKPEEPVEYTKQEKKQVIKEFNEKPPVKNNGIMAIEKKKFYLFLIFGAVFLFLMATYIVWHSISFGRKDFSTNITLNNQIDTPDVPVTVNPTININNTIIFPNEILIKLKNETG